MAVKAGLFAKVEGLIAGKIKDRLFRHHFDAPGQAGDPAPGHAVVIGTKQERIAAFEIKYQLVVMIADAGALLPYHRFQYHISAAAAAFLQARLRPQMPPTIEQQRTLGGPDHFPALPGDTVADILRQRHRELDGAIGRGKDFSALRSGSGGRGAERERRQQEHAGGEEQDKSKKGMSRHGMVSRSGADYCAAGKPVRRPEWINGPRLVSALIMARS